MTDNVEEPQQINTPAQYPTASRVEDGIAYDISGKKLGPVDVNDQPAAAAPSGFDFGFGKAAPQPQTGFDFGFNKQQQPPESRYHQPKPLLDEISDKGFLSGVGSWLRDDGSTVLKRQDGQVLQSNDGGTNWEPYKPQEGDYQTKKGGPLVNIISAGQKPGTITHHNPIVPLPGESFSDTMRRAVDAGKKVTPEQLKEDEDENLKEAPGTLATAVALGAGGPVIYGGAKGVSILKQALVGGDSQILGHPDNLETPEFRKAHPYWTGAMETLGGLSGPENASMLIGTGALGKLPGAASKIASRLVSSGFGLSMLSSAVKNVPELWDVMQGNGKYADMSDDDREWTAKNMMFHLTTDAAMATQALEHGATGESTPLTEYGEAADMIASKYGRLAVQTAKDIPSASYNALGAMMGRTNDFDTAIKRASNIPSKKVAAHMEKIANVREDLQAILNANPDVSEPKEFANAINNHIQTMEGKLQKEAGATKNSEEPVVPNITQRITERLDKFFDDNKGLYGDESDIADAKKRILEGILQSRGGEHLLEPNLFEAENVRRRFSRQGQPQFATNAIPTTDAFRAGSLEAADELRGAIDESYYKRGVRGVQDARTREANLIDIRDRLTDAQGKAEKMGEGSVFRSLMKKIGAPSSVIAIALGHPISGAAVGAAVLGDQIAQNLTNPNVNISRAMDIASRNPNARVTVPFASRVNTPLHGALAGHYGELIGQSTYDELQGRFMAEIAAKRQRGQALEAPEKKLLDMLNEARLNDNLDRQKTQDELRKNLVAVKSATLPENHEPVMPVEGKMHENMGTQEGLVHEIAHAYVANERGIKLADGIRSHNHPENKADGSLMSLPIDYSPFIAGDTINRAKIRSKAADLAATFVAGGVANEMWHGVPIDENTHLGADLDILRNQILRPAGFTKLETERLINQAIEDARQSLSRPNVRELMEQHAQVREPDLDNQHHFSQERLNQVLSDLRQGAGNETTTGKSARPSKDVGGRAKDSAARGKEGGEEGNPAELRQQSGSAIEGKGSNVGEAKPSSADTGTEAARNRVTVKKGETTGPRPEEFEPIPRPEGGWKGPKLEAPPEQTTGKYDRAIKEGGAIPGGIQEGDKEYDEPDLALFHDPQTGSTLALPVDDVNPENIARELKKSRDQFAAGEPESPRLGKKKERETPFGNKYLMRIGGEAGDKYTETNAHSGKQAIESVRKKFPDATEWAVESNKPNPGPDRYSVPTGKHLSVRGNRGAERDLQTMIHEHGHSMIGQKEGLEPLGMYRHTHPDVPSGATASLAWSPVGVQDPVTGRLNPEKALAILKSGMAGIAADEAFSGIPRDQNINFTATHIPYSDGGKTLRLLKSTGLTTEQSMTAMHNMIDQAKEYLTNPHVSDIIKESAGTREPGLSRQYHYSPDRLKQMHQEAQRRITMDNLNELNRRQNGITNNGPNAEQGGQGRGEVVPGGEGTATQAPNPAARAAQEPGAGVGLSPEDQHRAAVDKYQKLGYPRDVAEEQATRERLLPQSPKLGARTLSELPKHHADAVKDYLDDMDGITSFDPNTAKFSLRNAPLKNLEKAEHRPLKLNQIDPSMSGKSKTQGPITLDSDYSVIDGMHRLADKWKQGARTIPAWVRVEDAPENPKLGGLKETSTGSPEHDQAIKEAGAIPAGEMFPGEPYAVKMFHDPQTGSTLGFKPNEQPSADLVRQKLADSRAQYGIKTPENPKLSSDRVSTRVPEGKNATEDPLKGEPLIIGRKALEASPEKLQDRFADNIRKNVPGLKIPKTMKDTGKIFDRFVNHVADNLKFLYNQSTPEEQTNNAKWYESAHKLTKDLAEKHGVTHPQAAGVTAAMSPQMDWDQNVSLTKRIVDIYKNHADKEVTPEMYQKGLDIVQKSRLGKDKKANSNLEQLLPGIVGKKIGDLTGWDRAAAVRLYDEVNNPRHYPRIDPATGNEMETVTTKSGAPQNVAWGNLNNIGKALSILDNGSRENISQQVGNSHKVRNFFNNIIDPTNPDDVTIDTHAVAAGTLQPLSGNAKLVADNFGGAGKSKATGVAGLYPLIADAYRKAASDIGVMPRELQSVTWEKIRNTFPAEWKTADNLKLVNKEWAKYESGKQPLNQTRQRIMNLPVDKSTEVRDNTPKAGLAALGEK